MVWVLLPLVWWKSKGSQVDSVSQPANNLSQLVCPAGWLAGSQLVCSSGFIRLELKAVRLGYYSTAVKRRRKEKRQPAWSSRKMFNWAKWFHSLISVIPITVAAAQRDVWLKRRKKEKRDLNGFGNGACEPKKHLVQLPRAFDDLFLRSE